MSIPSSVVWLAGVEGRESAVTYPKLYDLASLITWLWARLGQGC